MPTDVEKWKIWRKEHPEFVRQCNARRYAKIKSDPELLARVRSQQREWARRNKDKVAAKRKEAAEQKRLAAEAAERGETLEDPCPDA